MLQIIKKNKNKIIKIAIITGIVFCVFGLMDKIFENTIFNLFKNLTKPYWRRLTKNQKNCSLLCHC